jgi:glycosyltransferase involved in cell wall biosynthesis
LGRADPLKGVHNAIKAFEAMPRDIKATFEVIASGEAAENSSYRKKLKALAAKDARIRFRGPIAAIDLPTLFEGVDTLLVPSVGFETGPLVVLEALAAGVRVIGSANGGISEWAEQYRGGWINLVDPWDTSAWTRAMQEAVASPLTDVDRPSVRTMNEVSRDMKYMYSTVLEEQPPR